MTHIFVFTNLRNLNLNNIYKRSMSKAVTLNGSDIYKGSSTIITVFKKKNLFFLLCEPKLGIWDATIHCTLVQS